MHTTQISLTDEQDDHDEHADTATTDRESSSRNQMNLAPPDQRGGERSCPWCLASPDIFEHHDDGTVGCGYCNAVIPVGADWYERGEKITI